MALIKLLLIYHEKCQLGHVKTETVDKNSSNDL